MTAQGNPNILLIAIDSLRVDRLSCYGYHRLTTPHIDRFATESVLFENTFSAHIPTTSAYASMLTGMDCFSTQVVALRHQGGLRPEVKRWRKSCATLATTRHASASPGIRVRADSIPTWNMPVGEAGTKAAARKRKT